MYITYIVMKKMSDFVKLRVSTKCFALLGSKNDEKMNQG